MEFRVEFVDGLLEVGAVYAVVGADCRRDVFMSEQHLDDFRVFARLEQYTRISVPQGMEVELVRCQSVLAHKALEYRLNSGICAQFPVVAGKHQVVRADKRLACRTLLHPTGFLPFEQSGFQYVGHRHFAHACRRFGVRDYGAVVYDFAFRVARGGHVPKQGEKKHLEMRCFLAPETTPPKILSAGTPRGIRTPVRNEVTE